jgi:hypothetical protein
MLEWVGDPYETLGTLTSETLPQTPSHFTSWKATWTCAHLSPPLGGKCLFLGDPNDICSKSNLLCFWCELSEQRWKGKNQAMTLTLACGT